MGGLVVVRMWLASNTNIVNVYLRSVYNVFIVCLHGHKPSICSVRMCTLAYTTNGVTQFAILLTWFTLKMPAAASLVLFGLMSCFCVIGIISQPKSFILC